MKKYFATWFIHSLLFSSLSAIQFRTSDGSTVTRQQLDILKLNSSFIKNFLEDFQDQKQKENEEVCELKITMSALKHLVEILSFVNEEGLNNFLSNLSVDELLDLVIASRFLGIDKYSEDQVLSHWDDKVSEFSADKLFNLINSDRLSSVLLDKALLYWACKFEKGSTIITQNNLVARLCVQLENFLVSYLMRKNKSISTHIDLPGSYASIAWSLDGKYLAAGSPSNSERSSSIHIWDVESETIIFECKDLHQEFIKNLAWSPDGNLLATGSYDCKLGIWDIRERKLICSFNDLEGQISEISWSPNGRYLACSTLDEVRIWDKETNTMDSVNRSVLNCSHAPISWSPNSKYLAIGEEKDLMIWNAEISKFKSTLFTGHQSPISSIEWSSDNQCFIASDAKQNIIWFLDDRDPQPFGSGAEFVSFRPDIKSHIALIRRSLQDDTIEIWDIENTKNARKLCDAKIDNSIKSFFWSPQGGYLALAGNPVSIFDSCSGKCVRKLHGSHFYAAWHPGSRLLATGARGCIHILDLVGPLGKFVGSEQNYHKMLLLTSFLRSKDTNDIFDVTHNSHLSKLFNELSLEDKRYFLDGNINISRTELLKIKAYQHRKKLISLGILGGLGIAASLAWYHSTK